MAGEKQVVGKLGAAGRGDPRRATSTGMRLGGNVERLSPACSGPHPDPGNRRPPTCHLGGSRPLARGTAWAPGSADPVGRREGRRPGRLRPLPSRGSINWLAGEARSASPPAGRPASMHTHPHPAQARAYTHTHTHTATKPVYRRTARSQRAVWRRKGPGESWLRAQRAPSPRATPRRARPFTCARRRRASGSRRPRAGFRLRGQSPQPPPRGPPSPALRPPLGRRPERGRPLRPPRRGPARAAGRPGRARRRRGPGRPRSRQAPLGDRGVAAPGASAAARPRLLRLWRAGRAAGEGGAEGGPREQGGRQPPSSSAFFLFCRLHVAQVSNSHTPPTPSPWLIPLPGAMPPEPLPSVLLLPHPVAGLPAPPARRGRRVAQASHSSSSHRPPPGSDPPAAGDPRPPAPDPHRHPLPRSPLRPTTYGTRAGSPTRCIFILSLFSPHLKSSGRHRRARKIPDVWPLP